MSAADWTPERVALVTMWRAQGLTCGEIAKRLNAIEKTSFTRNAIIGKLLRLGVETKRDLRPERTRQSLRAQVRKRHGVPVLKAEPLPKPKAPARDAADPRQVAFTESRPGQCRMFCAGEEGAAGIVCGKPTEIGASWCAACARLVFQPAAAQARRRAA
ncbi:MAG: GcrA family cell cycle regulator [Hyphomonadaceae bacterium]